MKRSRFAAMTTSTWLLTVAIIASCGDGSSTEGTAAPSVPASESGVPTTEAASSQSSLGSVAPATPATPAPADDVAAIRAAFETFFDGTGTDVDAKVAVLQDGERYRSMLVDASANPQFQALTIDIRDIRLVPDAECVAHGAAAPCAVVTHDLLVGGAPALVAQESVAVAIDGTWFVASSAWCAVVALGGETCP